MVNSVSGSTNHAMHLIEGMIKTKAKCEGIIVVTSSDGNSKERTMRPWDPEQAKNEVATMSNETKTKMAEAALKGHMAILKDDGELVFLSEKTPEIDPETKFTLIENPKGAASRADDVFGEIHPLATRKSIQITKVSVADPETVAHIQNLANNIFLSMQKEAEEKKLTLGNRSMSHVKSEESSKSIGDGTQQNAKKMVRVLSSRHTDLGNKVTSRAALEENIQNLFEEISQTNKVIARLNLEKEVKKEAAEGTTHQLVGVPAAPVAQGHQGHQIKSEK